jgi:hypothetical protein
MPKMPNVHLLLDSADGIGAYNNFQILNPGQNMVQGMIKDVAVSEIQFPYDIPNVLAGYNVFELANSNVPPIQANPPLFIAIPTGFYTGTELAVIINSTIAAAGAANPTGALLPADCPTITYSATNNRFAWVDAVTPAYQQTWELIPSYSTQWVGGSPNSANKKNLLTIMGLFEQATSFPTYADSYQLGNNIPEFGAAPLVFTQFIDIVSNKLSRFQYLRDGSSSQGNDSTRRSDVVARLYTTNEISTYTTDPPGTRPFVIHRQFKNQRTFAWSSDGSVDAVDIQLYDDFGSPLPTAWGPRPFQITLHVYQNDTTESGTNLGYTA